MNTSLTLAIDELYRIFGFLNNKYYDNFLPIPVITIQSGTRQKAEGWFTPWKAWSNPETEEKFFEINISAEYLTSDIYHLVGILQHELVHFNNHLLEIKDTSEKHHNKKFKETAEKADLIVENSNTNGWSNTRPNENLIYLIDNDLIPKKDVFKIFRQVQEKPKAPKSQFKYECTECGLKAYGKPGLLIECVECNQVLIMEDEE